jgi:hypothetical protein
LPHARAVRGPSTFWPKLSRGKRSGSGLAISTTRYVLHIPPNHDSAGNDAGGSLGSAGGRVATDGRCASVQKSERRSDFRRRYRRRCRNEGGALGRFVGLSVLVPGCGIGHASVCVLESGGVPRRGRGRPPSGRDSSGAARAAWARSSAFASDPVAFTARSTPLGGAGCPTSDPGFGHDHGLALDPTRRSDGRYALPTK